MYPCYTYLNRVEQMPPLVDLTGKVFGRLTVVDLNTDRSTSKRKFWNCICDCGRPKIAGGDNLKNGKTSSCGCLFKEIHPITQAKRRKFAPEEKAFRHIWRLMIRRCHNPRDNMYHHYGARDIKVCERWHDYYNFKSDMFPRPDGMTLERINNEEGYCPENCRWASQLDQCNNRRNSNRQTINGTTKTVSEWCRHYGISSSAVYQRLGRGWDIKSALTKPIRQLCRRSN